MINNKDYVTDAVIEKIYLIEIYECTLAGMTAAKTEVFSPRRAAAEVYLRKGMNSSRQFGPSRF